MDKKFLVFFFFYQFIDCLWVQRDNSNKIVFDFEIEKDHLISARGPDLVLIDKKKRTCHLVDFTIPMDHRVKIK